MTDIDLRGEVEAAALVDVERIGPKGLDTAALVKRFPGAEREPSDALFAGVAVAAMRPR
jgi:hypothetical protein